MRVPDPAGLSTVSEVWYWVEQELTRWLQTKPTDKMILVLTGGAAFWDRRTGDFDWNQTDAFPDCLGSASPRSRSGLTSDGPPESRSPGTSAMSRFLDAVGDISAILRGISKEQLIGEDVREHRKLLVLRRMAVATLAALTVAVGISAFAAFEQRNRAVANADRAEAASRLAQQNQVIAEQNEERALVNERDALRQRELAEERRLVAERERAEADRQRQQALLERNRAESRALASAALLSLGEDEQLALNLAVEAVRLTPTEQAEHALRRALLAARSLDPDRVGEIYWEGSRTDAGEPIADAIKPLFARSRVGQTLTSADGQRTVSVTDCCSLTVREVIDTRPRTLILSGHTDSIEAIAFDPSQRFIVSGAQDQTVRLWDASTGQPLDVFSHDGQVVQVAFSTDGSAIIANSRRTRRAWESRLGKPTGRLTLTTSFTTTCAPSRSTTSRSALVATWPHSGVGTASSW